MTMKHPRSTLTPKLYRLAYEQAKLVLAKSTKRAEALRICVKAGFRSATASFYIGNLPQLLNGHPYHRGMSIESTRAILQWILEDYGIEAQKNAVASVLLHIKYVESKSKGKLVGMSEMVAEVSEAIGRDSLSTGIDDIPDKPIGNQCPDRAIISGVVIIRDPRVRRQVVVRSRGKCEHCGTLGFPLPNGNHYVEAHHIIYLAKDGPDTLGNVIALCPNHHREAHFGTTAVSLEKAFLERIRELLKSQ